MSAQEQRSIKGEGRAATQGHKGCERGSREHAGGARATSTSNARTKAVSVASQNSKETQRPRAHKIQ